MKLGTAIELNKESEQSLREHKFIEHADAVKMGNEALKVTQRERQTSIYRKFNKLPGETEE